MKPFLKSTSFHSKCQQPKNFSFIISNVFCFREAKKNEEESKDGPPKFKGKKDEERFIVGPFIDTMI